MTVDSLQIQSPGNISKKSLTMTKQIWASFTVVTGSFATEYQISDTGGGWGVGRGEEKETDAKDRALALWKRDI